MLPAFLWLLWSKWKLHLSKISCCIFLNVPWCLSHNLFMFNFIPQVLFITPKVSRRMHLGWILSLLLFMTHISIINNVRANNKAEEINVLVIYVHYSNSVRWEESERMSWQFELTTWAVWLIRRTTQIFIIDGVMA